MAILSVNGVTKMFGTDVIIKDFTFEIQKGDRVGLVGINGSGKTTLFKVLSGQYEPDQGAFYPAKETVFGYMEQHVCNDDQRSAYSEVLTVFAHLMELEETLEALNQQLQVQKEGLTALITRQVQLNETFVDLGGLTYRSRAKSTLVGLGFDQTQMNNPVGVLSGGQKGKLQLAKMLLSGANFLLLDEPTNHLDITATEWLEDFLRGYNGAYIVISHDRYFLDKVTDHTFEVVNKSLYTYPGNYSTFLTLKAERKLTQARIYESTQKEITRIEGIITQQKRFNQARNYVTIASKQKSIDRLEATLERPEAEPDTIHFQFKASRRGGNEVLMAQDLGLSFAGKPLFSGVSLDIRRQEKVFLIGPNGCGKTSLLKVLLDLYRADSGNYHFGANIDVGYYDQAQGNLDQSKTVINEIWDLHPRMEQTEVRNALAVFLFKGEDVFKPVSGLSGGERARILLLKLMLQDTNFLILDEPTNHLDISAREALEDALMGYDGTLLVVSHDRYLMNKLSTKVLYLESTGITTYAGNYDSFLLERAKKETTEIQDAPPKVNEYKLNKERKAELRKMRTALARCESDIEELEGRMADLQQELNLPHVASDYEKTLALSHQMEELRQESTVLLEQWEATHLWLDENDEER